MGLKLQACAGGEIVLKFQASDNLKREWKLLHCRPILLLDKINFLIEGFWQPTPAKPKLENGRDCPTR